MVRVSLPACWYCCDADYCDACLRLLMAGLHVVGPSMKMLFNMIMHLLCDETSSVILKKP